MDSKDRIYIISHGTETYVVNRLTADGAIDVSYGNQGTSIVPNQSDSQNSAHVSVSSDGRVLLLASNSFSGQSNTLTVTVLNSNGVLDSTFGNQGVVTWAVNSAQGLSGITWINDQVQILAGAASANGNKYGVMARLLSNGSFDSQFGANGTSNVFLPFLYEDLNFASLTSSPDGSFYIAGDADDVAEIVKFNSIGQLDSTFGNQGSWSLPATGYSGALVDSLSLLQDGSLFASILSSANSSSYYLAHITAEGTTDPHFGDAGLITKSSKGELAGMSVVMINNGSFLISLNKKSLFVDRYNTGIWELDSKGSSVLSFGSSGQVFESPWKTNRSIEDGGIAHQSSGAVVQTYYNYNGSTFIGVER